MARRTADIQVQRAAPTLLAVAREYFAERGYADASLSAIVEAAGFTKGAVYHYFSNKQDLFRAVYVAEQARVTAAVVAAFRAEADVWEAFHAALAAYVQELLDEKVRRIILLDAPVALGWQTMRIAVSPSGEDLIREGLEKIAEAGLLSGHRVDILARLVFGAVCEAANLIGTSEHPETLAAPVLAELRLMLDPLVRSGG